MPVPRGRRNKGVGGNRLDPRLVRELVNVNTVKVDIDGLDQRMFGLDDVAVLLKRLAKLVAIPGLDGNDDGLRRRALSKRFANGAIHLAVR